MDPPASRIRPAGVDGTHRGTERPDQSRLARGSWNGASSTTVAAGRATIPKLQLDLAVNVSGRQLMDHDFCATVKAILARTDMDPASVCSK